MKIALYSDLHTEFVAGSHLKGYLSPLLKTDADVVVLAGDIASGRTNVKDVLKAFSDAYKHVIYVAGNHEYYGSSLEIFDDIGQLPDNVHFLNPGSVRIDGVTFIGGSLWTNFRNDPFAMLSAKSMISDFRSIQGFSPEIASVIYHKHLKFIQQAYVILTGKKVIVTHFLPAVECISPRFRRENLLNNYFANDLGDYIQELSDTTWMFGHTHDSMDFHIGDTRLVCNPYGYNGENNNFNFKKVINV